MTIYLLLVAIANLGLGYVLGVAVTRGHRWLPREDQLSSTGTEVDGGSQVEASTVDSPLQSDAGYADADAAPPAVFAVSDELAAPMTFDHLPFAAGTDRASDGHVGSSLDEGKSAEQAFGAQPGLSTKRAETAAAGFDERQRQSRDSDFEQVRDRSERASDRNEPAGGQHKQAGAEHERSESGSALSSPRKLDPTSDVAQINPTNLERAGESKSARTAQIESPASDTADLPLNETIDAASHLKDVELESILLAGCEVLLNETSKLAAPEASPTEAGTVSHRFDAGKDAEPRAAEVLGALAGMSELAGLVDTAWLEDPKHSEALSVAIIDPDRLESLAIHHGAPTAERVLAAVARVIQGVIRPDDLVAWESGKPFAIVLRNMDARASASMAERVRQTIEAIQFRRKAADFDVTVTCGVTEATSEDTVDTLLARAMLTLQEAQRYGHNRTFLHEGRFPTPVVPPQFAIETRVLEV